MRHNPVSETEHKTVEVWLVQSDKLVAWSFQERFEYSGKFSDRQDQKECSMIKRQKLQTYSPHLFLAPIPYLQKMDNITWREKVWLLPITTQHICVFQKNVVKYLTGTNHNFSEVMANLPLPRSKWTVLYFGVVGLW